MEVIIQFVQTEKNNTAEGLVMQKLQNLSKHFNWIIKANVFFKEIKDTKGKGKICEITLSCPGPQIFASSDEETFEAAATETIRDLQVQLNKRKAEMKPY